MAKSTVSSMCHFIGLFLALTLTVPTPAFALRTPENAEAKGGLEELESALRNPSDPGRAAATVLGRQLATTLGIPAAQLVPVPPAGLEEQIPGTNIQVSWSTTSNDPAEDLRFLTKALSHLKQLDPESYRNAITSIRTITLMNLPADQWATHAPSQGIVNLQWPFLLSETEADREILLLGVLARGAEYRRFAGEALENLDLIDVDAGGDAIDASLDGPRIFTADRIGQSYSLF